MKARRINCILIAIFLSVGTTYSIAQKNTHYIGFYNVENLFDTIDQSNNDEEFLPSGKNAWTSERYVEKIKLLNQVIDSMGNLALLGLCEVENKGVISDLNAASVKRKEFAIIHYDSPDLRGIDVAMIYDPTLFSLHSSGIIRFEIANPETPNTRDILWAKLVYKKDTLMAMVNHWPSRRGGQQASNPNRIRAAQMASDFIDSVQVASPQTKFVFMGDLNDYPDNEAPKMIAQRLEPYITHQSGKFGGSYNYRGEWDILDHIFVSSNARKGRLRFIAGSGEILSSDFLLEEYKGSIVPKRSYAGSNYLGGYSDHLPVRVKIELK